MPPTSAFREWGKLMLEASLKNGRSLSSALKYESMLRDAGYIDVKVVKNLWPSNYWPKDPKYKELGQWNQVNALQGLHGFSMALFTRVLEWTPVRCPNHPIVPVPELLRAGGVTLSTWLSTHVSCATAPDISQPFHLCLC